MAVEPRMISMRSMALGSMGPGPIPWSAALLRDAVDQDRNRPPSDLEGRAGIHRLVVRDRPGTSFVRICVILRLGEAASCCRNCSSDTMVTAWFTLPMEVGVRQPRSRHPAHSPESLLLVPRIFRFGRPERPSRNTNQRLTITRTRLRMEDHSDTFHGRLPFLH